MSGWTAKSSRCREATQPTSTMRRVPSEPRSSWTTRSTAALTWSCSASNGTSTSLIDASVSSRISASTVRVGVHGGQRALVAGVHGLEHVERLAAADLADDDAVGAHAQRVADQVADGDLAVALDVRRAGLQPDHVVLRQGQLGGVLDGDDALAPGMNADSALSIVVLPDAVPPETMMLSRARTQAASSSAVGSSRLPRSSSSSRPYALGNSRIVTVGPLSASGGRTTLTRAPRGIRSSGGSRASTIGLDSSTRRLTVETMRSIVCSSCSSVANAAGDPLARWPNRST